MSSIYEADTSTKCKFALVPAGSVFCGLTFLLVLLLPIALDVFAISAPKHLEYCGESTGAFFSRQPTFESKLLLGIVYVILVSLLVPVVWLLTFFEVATTEDLSVVWTTIEQTRNRVFSWL